MVRVLIVDDSIVAQKLLNHIYSQDKEIQVVGIANNGAEAVELTLRNKPDVISMDLQMPEMDGYETTRRIMETRPTPIVVVSGTTNTKEISVVFKIIEAGALTAVNRPPAPTHPDFDRLSLDLRVTIKLMAAIKVEKKIAKKERFAKNGLLSNPVSENIGTRYNNADVRLIAIGASTGGPGAIQKILFGLPKNLRVPILIIQHIAYGFINGFAEWLTSTTGFTVKVAYNNEYISAGIAYLSPDGFNLGVDITGKRILCVKCKDDLGISSVSHLFENVAKVIGGNAVGVILSGMGNDGAKELKLMREQGSVTIAQDSESCVVFGMPNEAIQLGGAVMILPVDKIAATLISLINGKEPLPEKI